MRSVKLLLTASILMLGLAATAAAHAQQGSGSSQHCEINYGGQYHIVGSVCVTIEGDTLTLDYIMEDGWTINEAHAWVGDNLASMPQNGNGTPIPGQLPYSTTTSATDQLTFVMNISDLNLNIDTYCESGLYVAAHGVVSKPGHTGTETSWAGETRFTQRGNWATYFGVSNPCPPEEPPPEEPPPEEPPPPVEICYLVHPVYKDFREADLVIAENNIGKVGAMSYYYSSPDIVLEATIVGGETVNWPGYDQRNVNFSVSGGVISGSMELCGAAVGGPS